MSSESSEPDSEAKISLLERVELAYATWKASKDTFSCRKIARQYGIPKSTFVDRIYGTIPRKTINQRRQKLTFVEEDQLCKWVLQLQAWG